MLLQAFETCTLFFALEFLKAQSRPFKINAGTFTRIVSCDGCFCNRRSSLNWFSAGKRQPMETCIRNLALEVFLHSTFLWSFHVNVKSRKESFERPSTIKVWCVQHQMKPDPCMGSCPKPQRHASALLWRKLIKSSSVINQPSALYQWNLFYWPITRATYRIVPGAVL